MAIRLYKATMEREVVFVGDSDWSDPQLEDAADRAMSEHASNYFENVDEVYSLTHIPVDWEDCVPYDPEGLCETDETVKEMFNKQKG